MSGPNFSSQTQSNIFLINDLHNFSMYGVRIHALYSSKPACKESRLYQTKLLYQYRSDIARQVSSLACSGKTVLTLQRPLSSNAIT
jgi:hypothetical protein